MTATVNQCKCGEPTAGAHMCQRCSRTLSFALVNAAGYFLELEVVERKQTRFSQTGNSGGRSVGKTQPLIVDDRFLDDRRTVDGRQVTSIGKGTALRRDTETIVATWHTRTLAGHPPIIGPGCGDTCLHVSCATIRSRTPAATSTVPARILYLARQLRWILTQPWCTDLMADFLGIETRLTRMVDSPPPTWYAGVCSVPLEPDDDGNPVACATELYARADRGFIDCKGCGTRHDVADRRDILLQAAQDAHVTATQAASALIAWTDYDGTITKLVDRIRKWRDRNRLDVLDVTPDLHNRDRHLYRLGDIQALLIEAAQTKQAKRVGAPT